MNEPDPFENRTEKIASFVISKTGGNLGSFPLQHWHAIIDAR
jgi:hypothetical protein